MKIGIITPYDSANFGAMLQAYASKTVLEQKGHEVYFIKWRSERERKKIFFQLNGNGLRRKLAALIDIRFNAEKYRIFSKDIVSYPVISMDAAKNGLDIVYLGSDEIWNIKAKSFASGVFYGEGFPCSVAAYAPSCGNACADDFLKCQDSWKIIDAMQRIEIAGVRDTNTQKIVQSLTHKEVPLVCDPTLLLNIEDYPVSEIDAANTEYILVYAYRVSDELKKELIHYSRKHNMKLIALCNKQKWCDYNLNCSAAQFISYIRNAHFVVTSTFHGTIFTALNKQNCVIEAKSKKLMDFVERMSLKDFCYDENSGLEYCVNKDKSYDVFDSKVEQMKTVSNQRLDEVLLRK